MILIPNISFWSFLRVSILCLHYPYIFATVHLFHLCIKTYFKKSIRGIIYLQCCIRFRCIGNLTLNTHSDHFQISAISESSSDVCFVSSGCFLPFSMTCEFLSKVGHYMSGKRNWGKQASSVRSWLYDWQLVGASCLLLWCHRLQFPRVSLFFVFPVVFGFLYFSTLA